jgi:putative transcriptional regulator
MSKKKEELSGEELGQMLLDSVRQMKAGKVARTQQVEQNDVVAARMTSGLSQSEFAQALGISVRTLQEWEQGRRSPSGAARTLIGIAARHPQIIVEAVRVG